MLLASDGYSSLLKSLQLWHFIIQKNVIDFHLGFFPGQTAYPLKYNIMPVLGYNAHYKQVQFQRLCMLLYMTVQTF